MLDRLVTQMEPPPEHIEAQKSGVFNASLDCHNIILLGDPGLGKTHLFKQAARHEGAVYKTVRQFVCFEGEDCEGKIVYRDAVDEFRSRSADKSLLRTLYA